MKPHVILTTVLVLVCLGLGTVLIDNDIARWCRSLPVMYGAFIITNIVTCCVLGWLLGNEKMKTHVILSTVFVLLSLQLGMIFVRATDQDIARWFGLRRRPGSEQFVMDDFWSATMTQRTWRLMNYIHDGHTVEFEN